MPFGSGMPVGSPRAPPSLKTRWTPYAFPAKPARDKNRFCSIRWPFLLNPLAVSLAHPSALAVQRTVCVPDKDLVGRGDRLRNPKALCAQELKGQPISSYKNTLADKLTWGPGGRTPALRAERGLTACTTEGPQCAVSHGPTGAGGAATSGCSWDFGGLPHTVLRVGLPQNSHGVASVPCCPKRRGMQWSCNGHAMTPLASQCLVSP